MINIIPKIDAIFRYDPPEVSDLIFHGSIKITTLEACRNAENDNFGDKYEATKVTTSLPGKQSLTGFQLANLLGVDPMGISVSGPNAVVTNGESAVHRTERLPNAFIFCTSRLDNSPILRKRFGDNCLKIVNPYHFFELIDFELRNKYQNELGPCIVDEIEYTPRTNNYENHTNKHSAFIYSFFRLPVTMLHCAMPKRINYLHHWCK